MLEIKRKHNLRDLGGFMVNKDHEVRRSMIYRSGSLHNLSNSDALELERSGISVILDLRTPLEIEEKPDTLIPGVKYIRTPFLTDSTVGITRQSGSDPVKIIKKLRKDKEELLRILPDMEALYLQMVLDPVNQKQLGLCMNTIIDTVLEGKKVLFHCTAGKDRTGIMAALLLNILGVSRTDVLKDYIKTNRSVYSGAVKRGFLIGAMTRSFNMGLTCYQLFMAQQRHLIKTMSLIRKKYGSTDAFVIDTLGVGAEKLSQFKQKMIVPAKHRNHYTNH